RRASRSSAGRAAARLTTSPYIPYFLRVFTAMTSSPTSATTPRLTDLAHGGGCGCKIAPGLLKTLLKNALPTQTFPNLLVGTETSDDAAVYWLNDEQALVATTDF